MTPGPSFTMPTTSSSAPTEPAADAASSSATSSAASEQPRSLLTANIDPADSHAIRNGNMDPSSSDALRRSEASLAQPKHCARCGQLLDAAPSSHERQPTLSRTPSSASISAPSPSSYAFAPDSIRSHHRLQPHQSLTSAINAAAAVALSRHLGTDDSIPTDADGHAICTQCAAQLATTPNSSAQPSSTSESAHTTDTQQPQTEATSSAVAQPATQSVAGFSPNASGTSSILAPSDAPQTQLTISVDNMGAGGDASLAPSAEDVLMQDPTSFSPLEHAPIATNLRSPASMSSVTRSTSRGRIRFAATAGHQQYTADLRDQTPESSSALARSGSFSRSLSYNGSESVSSSSAPVVVSFPSSIAATPAFETAPALTSQAAHPLASSASLPARSSNSQSASRNGSNVDASSNTQASTSSVQATASGGVKQRRPSSARRPSRSGSSTGPTNLPFAAVGALGAAATAVAAPTTLEAELPKNDDPFGPGAVTRPRLSQLSTHAIADELYRSARQARPPSLISSSTSTSLATSSAQHAAGIDPARSVRYHPDPLSFAQAGASSALARSVEKSRHDETQSMDVDEDKVALGLAAKLDEVRWFDPYKPDPLAELSRLRNPPKGRGCLYPGATFNGTQKSGRNSYDVTVRVVNVDLEASHLCGYLNIRGLTEDWPELTTYFDAEIIGDRYGFVTGKWGATEADDLKHWARFRPFRPLRSALSKPGLRFNHLNKPFVFMRWKEKFLVPDHRVRDINGASFAGFYYVCVELGEGVEGRGRGGSESLGSGDVRGGGEEEEEEDGGVGSSSGVGLGSGVSGQQWYAARAQRRRELSLSSPSYPLSAGGQQFGQAFQREQRERERERDNVTYYHPIYHPHSPNGLAPSGPGFWPASPTSPHMPFGGGAGAGSGGEDSFTWEPQDDDEYDDLGATGKMSGFYFHENSEPYQQLSLHHTAESCSSGFELR